MTLIPGRYVFCEQRRITDICKNFEGIHVETIEAKLEGYQIYLVEQWTIERNREVATTVSFTGDPAHTTPYGHLFVTNLSLFDSLLNIVLVPDGDFDYCQQRFYLNLNLRRMGCSGRSALTFKPPSDAQREKFNQLYKISVDQNEFMDTVIRLVDLVQNCLFIFGLFKLEDVDGLLCDATEMGLDEFYNTFLSTKFQKFTTENKLDPSVLAGLFSKVSSVRSKLQHLVNNVPKDPIAEPVAFINAIKAFQHKKSDLKTYFLDHKTVKAIMATYQSSFNPQGLKVHKVLKSKIEDFSGMTAVNPEGETTDLEAFAKNITTESLKQVWRGKPKHKPDMADALVSGDWLTGGKELGKSLVRGFGKNSKESKESKESKDSKESKELKDVKDSKDSKETKYDKSSVKVKSSKNRHSMSFSKGKSPFANMKEGIQTDETLVYPSPIENHIAKSDEDVEESDELQISTPFVPPTINLQGSEEEPSSSAAEATPQPASIPVSTPNDYLTSLLSQKPEPPGKPEIVRFYLDRKVHRPNSGSPRKRAQSMTGLAGEERLLGCRIEASKPVGLVVECDMLNYNSYQLLKEKEETLRSMYDRMQTVEKEYAGHLESLKSILEEREKQFNEIQREAVNIMRERAELLAEVEEKEHATQISVYKLDGMVGKLVEMRDFTGAFFNKISYLDTKLPVSQRRLVQWMDGLQDLQSQWLGTIGRYVKAYAPTGIRDRFTEWEKKVQFATTQARELRGEVEIGHLTPTTAISRVPRSMSAVIGASPVGGSNTSDSPNFAISTARDMKSGGSQVHERRGAVTEPMFGVGSYMATPQSLKTEGHDLRMSSRGVGFVINDGENDFASSHGFTSTPRQESTSTIRQPHLSNNDSKYRSHGEKRNSSRSSSRSSSTNYNHSSSDVT
ncbi:hypothetical protein BGZ80_004212, partial [Entomortierella chlamydospora]